MSLPFTSLNAATTVGPGTINDLETVSDDHTIISSCTGGTPGPFSAVVALEGSHDGVTWAPLSAGVSFSTSNSGVSSTTPVRSALVRYVRANLTTLYGGTAPTVTVTIASKITEDD